MKQFRIMEVNYLRYILLLRGVNVGGKNKVPMSELKERAELPDW